MSTSGRVFYHLWNFPLKVTLHLWWTFSVLTRKDFFIEFGLVYRRFPSFSLRYTAPARRARMFHIDTWCNVSSGSSTWFYLLTRHITEWVCSLQLISPVHYQKRTYMAPTAPSPFVGGVETWARDHSFAVFSRNMRFWGKFQVSKNILHKVFYKNGSHTNFCCDHFDEVTALWK